MLANERNLSARIAFEREQRGWTYDGIATRLTQIGYPMLGSAIYKIEKGDPLNFRVDVEILQETPAISVGRFVVTWVFALPRLEP